LLTILVFLKDPNCNYDVTDNSNVEGCFINFWVFNVNDIRFMVDVAAFFIFVCLTQNVFTLV
jgi:hypothetical protein